MRYFFHCEEVEVQKAADVAGKILNAPMKVDQLQRDNPLKATEPWFNILTTSMKWRVVRILSHGSVIFSGLSG